MSYLVQLKVFHIHLIRLCCSPCNRIIRLRADSTNPVASIFAWTRGLIHRAKLDNNEALSNFCKDLEAACVEVIDVDGVMTKDLALAIHGKNMKREHWVVTDVYLDAVNVSSVAAF